MSKRDIDHSRDLADGRLERMLEVFDDCGIKYTFPTTAQVFLENPDSMRQTGDQGPEIAGHEGHS